MHVHHPVMVTQTIVMHPSGVQVMSTNGAVTLLLRAPISGTVGRVNLASVVGDAFGSTAINLLDNAPPPMPAGVSVTAGQSRIWVSWRTNSEPDLAGYRIYYRMGVSGPPWDGTAAVEGTPSPVMVTGTNCLLRGLALGTNYFVAVSAPFTSCTGCVMTLSMIPYDFASSADMKKSRSMSRSICSTGRPVCFAYSEFIWPRR